MFITKPNPSSIPKRSRACMEIMTPLRVTSRKASTTISVTFKPKFLADNGKNEVRVRVG